MSQALKSRFYQYASNSSFWLVLSLITYAIYGIKIIASSSGVLDPGDGISHYEIARWSWEYPELFLDHWGKPLYTLLISPFAQFGIKGLLVFNLIVSIVSGVYIYLLAKKLNIPSALLATAFLLLSPLYFEIVMSGLTEILFAGLLTVGLYYLLSKKFLVATIILSFIPYSRTEGYFILPWIALYLLFIKEYRWILMLGFGTLVYIIVGGLYFSDLLWMVNNNPYSTGDGTLYGSGELNHFYNNRYHIFGQWCSNLMLLGFIGLIIRYIFRKRLEFYHINNEVFMLLVVWGGMSTVFAIHSYFWWHGGFSSIGLLRVMLCILPLGVIAAVYSFRLFEFVSATKIKQYAPVLLSILFAYSAFNKHQGHIAYPFKESNYEEPLSGAADFYNKNFSNERVYYFHPYFAFAADINPYDQSKAFKPYHLNNSNINMHLKHGDILVWDSHFGLEQPQLDLDSMISHPKLLLKSIHIPKEAIKLHNGADWGVYVFQKSDSIKEIEVDTIAEISMGPDFETLFVHNQFSSLLQYFYPKKSLGPLNSCVINYSIKSYLNQVTLVTAIISNNELLFAHRSHLHSTNSDLIQGQTKVVLPPNIPKNAELRVYLERSNNRNSEIEFIEFDMTVTKEVHK